MRTSRAGLDRAPSNAWRIIGIEASKLFSIGSRLGFGGCGTRGSVAIMTAVAATVLLGFAALAVDVSIWEVNVSRMQGAADQAARAAGLVMTSGASAARQEAKGVAAAHGFIDGAGGVSVAVNIPPSTGAYASPGNAIEVLISQVQPKYLSALTMSSPVTASARAVVVPAAGSTCIMALAPRGSGISVLGLASINAGSCDIYVNSNTYDGVCVLGLASVKGQDVFLGYSSRYSLCNILGSITATDKVTTSSEAAKDPYVDRTIPVPLTTCKSQKDIRPDLVLSPGTYCGLTFGPGDNVKLRSGTYIFDGGGLSVLGGAIITTVGDPSVPYGVGVSLIFTSSTNTYGGISITGGSSITLTPLTLGPTAGMAIWLDAKGGAGFSETGVNIVDITGAVYAPKSTVTWLGVTSSVCTQLIAYRIQIFGLASFRHTCDGLNVSDVGTSGGYKLQE